LKEIIHNISKELSPFLVEFRREMHQHPELSFKEFNTTDRIENTLSDMNLEFKRISETGTVAMLGNDPSKRTIALRADIDALPILEQNEVNYTSNNEGVMHACGHDVHTTCLIGAAKILQKLEVSKMANVKLIFQAGEEKLPGGASILVDKGVLNDVDFILGQHVMPELPVGTFGFRPGKYMASADEIYIKIIGKGGHAAIPQNCIDPIPIAAQVITGLQQIVSRKSPALTPSVLSIGKVIADGATNVIPKEVNMEGTFRTLDEKWRSEAHILIKNLIENTCKSFGAECEVDIKVGYPYLENDPSLTISSQSIARELSDSFNVIDLDIRMTAEDFSFYSQKIPACFYRLGVGNQEKGIVHGIHNSRFDVDENCLQYGAAMMAWLAYNHLQNNHSA
jgi:amidohydrolase